MDLVTVQSQQKKLHKKNILFFVIGGVLLCALFLLSLFIGKYPFTIEGLLAGDERQWLVFKTLRLSRSVVGVVGGFALGVSGYVYQMIFRNQLASPDIIGVASGASAGAAFGILYFAGSIAVTACAFGGAFLAVVFTLLLASIDRSGKNATVILAGIAVHAFAQTILMCLKLIADPEKELASIEYWIMGSLNGINSHSIWLNVLLIVVSMVVLILLHRSSLILASSEGEAKMLGLNVNAMRLVVLLTATVAVASVVSMTGLISFVGLVAPHIAKKLIKNNSIATMIMCGIIGSCLLVISDVLARSVAATELPVSIFTSIIGVPFLVFIILRGRTVS